MLKRQSHAKSAFDGIIAMDHRLFLVFIFALIVACTTPPKWDIYEGLAKEGYPGEHWQKAATPEQLGWSSEKLSLAPGEMQPRNSNAIPCARVC
jgi:hypothetical protein